MRYTSLRLRGKHRIYISISLSSKVQLDQELNEPLTLSTASNVRQQRLREARHPPQHFQGDLQRALADWEEQGQ